MRLTQKTLITVAATVIVLFTVFYLIAQSYVLGVFAEIERQQALRTVAQVRGVFQDRIEEIGLLAADWAAWDDTYAFVNDANQAFIDSNITEVTFANGPLDLVAIYDLAGLPVVERRYDRQQAEYLPAWPEYLSQRQPDSLLLTHDTVDSVRSGVLMVAGEPLLIAALPVINSQGEGPIRGTLVMARLFDDDALAELSGRVLLEVAWSAVRRGDPLHIEPSIEEIDDEQLLGQQTLLDLFGQPAMTLQLRLERQIYSRAMAVRDTLLVAVVLAALIMALIMRVLLREVIEKRMEKLSARMNDIARDGSEFSRVELEGNDELADLAANINAMLEALKHANKALSNSRRAQNLEQLFATLPAVAYLKDRSGAFVAVNDLFCEVYRVERERVLGRCESGFGLSIQPTESVRQETDAYTSGELVAYVESYRGADWAANIVPLLDNRGAVDGVIGVKFDITEQKRVQQELEALVGVLRQASRAKDQFLANMSHEIRTPMNGVLGMLELIQTTELNGEQREFVETAAASGRMLMALLNDILDLSKIEAGELVIDSRPSDLALIMSYVQRAQEAHAQERRLQLVAMVAVEQGQLFMLDELRLQQILHNLINNAIKFTDEGEVRVTVKLKAGERGELLRFEVRDTGIGIEPDAQKTVFDRFIQADSSTTRKFGGTGLGLAICKRLVALMGGKIGLQSQPGEGSTFWFEIPAKRADGSAD